MFALVLAMSNAVAVLTVPELCYPCLSWHLSVPTHKSHSSA